MSTEALPDVVTLRGRRADTRTDRLSVGDPFERPRWSRPEHVVLTGHPEAYEHPDHRELTVTHADDLANRFAQDALRDGWFHGGDAFRRGEAGQRILVDRFKDIVKSGGENVSSIRSNKP